MQRRQQRIADVALTETQPEPKLALFQVHLGADQSVVGDGVGELLRIAGGAGAPYHVLQRRHATLSSLDARMKVLTLVATGSSGSRW